MYRLVSLSTIAIVSSLLMIAATFSTSTPALAQDDTEAQCLAKDECRALREELRGFKQELKPMRREMRQLRQQIRETPEGEERDALIAQARGLHREVKQIQRERRPVTRQYRSGCRRQCFAN